MDTGLNKAENHIKNIKWRTNWADQPTHGADGNGHGTASAGSVASTNPNCAGAAPDVDIYTLKVFTDKLDSFTSWYVDAINFLFVVKVHMINLSIGGLDFNDFPFVHKVRKLIVDAQRSSLTRKGGIRIVMEGE